MRESKFDGFFYTVTLLIILGNVVFWGAVGYVAWHFISKLW